MDPVGRSACGPSRDGHKAGKAGLINEVLCHLIQETKSIYLHLCATRNACHGAGSAIVDSHWSRICGWFDVHSIACTPTRKAAVGLWPVISDMSSKPRWVCLVMFSVPNAFKLPGSGLSFRDSVQNAFCLGFDASHRDFDSAICLIPSRHRCWCGMRGKLLLSISPILS